MSSTQPPTANTATRYANDISGLSPLVDQHINVLGRYAFTAPAPTGLRPFRDPTNEP